MSGMEWCASTPETKNTDLGFSPLLGDIDKETYSLPMIPFCLPPDRTRCQGLVRHQTALTRVLTEAETDAVRVGNVVHSPISGGVEDEGAAGAGRGAPFFQANIISEGITVLRERIPIDLACIEIN